MNVYGVDIFNMRAIGEQTTERLVEAESAADALTIAGLTLHGDQRITAIRAVPKLPKVSEPAVREQRIFDGDIFIHVRTGRQMVFKIEELARYV